MSAKENEEIDKTVKELNKLSKDPDEVAKHHRIVESVQTIMRLKEQLAISPNATQRTVIERSIVAINNDLNSEIDALYQVEFQNNEE